MYTSGRFIYKYIVYSTPGGVSLYLVCYYKTVNIQLLEYRSAFSIQAKRLRSVIV